VPTPAALQPGPSLLRPRTLLASFFTVGTIAEIIGAVVDEREPMVVATRRPAISNRRRIGTPDSSLRLLAVKEPLTSKRPTAIPSACRPALRAPARSARPGRRAGGCHPGAPSAPAGGSLRLDHGGRGLPCTPNAPPGAANRRRRERQREAPAAGRRPGPREAARAARQGRLDGQQRPIRQPRHRPRHRPR
jgi:hypothetical protein